MGGPSFAKNSESSCLPSTCHTSLSAQQKKKKKLKTVRWKVKDLTSDGVKIQRPAAKIKLYVSVHIFFNIPDADDMRLKRGMQSESSSQLYLCVNMQAQVYLQLGDCWSATGNTYYHKRQSRHLPCLASPPLIVTLVPLKKCVKLCFLPTVIMTSWLVWVAVAAQPHPL